jgi:hypothetical protein
MKGEYDFQKQYSGMKAAEFAKDIQESVHPRTQEAITNWIEAQGDIDVLLERAQNAPESLRQGYIDATMLDPRHTLLAENIKSYFESRLEQAQIAGVLDQGIEDYVHHIWDRSSKVAQTVRAEANAGMLRKNPALAKKRVFETFFDGEQLGYVPKDKRIGYLLTAYDVSLNEAIAARAFIKSLLEGKASDGRPLVEVSGSGKTIPDTEESTVFIIKPKTKLSMDYMPVYHPALTKWKWAAKDSEGKPIFVQGDLVVHPEIYKDMKNILGKSRIREYEVAGYRIGAAVLNGMQILKSTLLSLSGFHQVQEGVHAVGHEVNPFKTPEINLDDPTQAALVKHGVIAYNHNAMAEFGEGLYGASLIAKVPWLGRKMSDYGEYLFQDYIPRLKMDMAVKAYARNTQRYEGKLNDHQILHLTAKEANAAFGELNYLEMGRNKTLQDMFRLVALAPDFLEARAKFVAQGLKPYGREQSVALVRIAAYMAITAQVTNYLINREMDWSQPFAIKIDNRYYMLRSIPADLVHLVTKPRSFTYHRLNPATARPVIEALTGRDQFGRERGIADQTVDYIKSFVPIPLQGKMYKKETSLMDSLLGSVGISSYKKR